MAWSTGIWRPEKSELQRSSLRFGFRGRSRSGADEPGHATQFPKSTFSPGRFGCPRFFLPVQAIPMFLQTCRLQRKATTSGSFLPLAMSFQNPPRTRHAAGFDLQEPWASREIAAGAAIGGRHHRTVKASVLPRGGLKLKLAFLQRSLIIRTRGTLRRRLYPCRLRSSTVPPVTG